MSHAIPIILSESQSSGEISTNDGIEVSGIEKYHCLWARWRPANPANWADDLHPTAAPKGSVTLREDRVGQWNARNQGFGLHADGTSGNIDK
ncbi:hypothetical protein [Nonomuraea sp. NPDC050643]|uniref:hypothetical protein n=1 Tax=Nonomuraea sp. NPDC050643 TaxID=3155660 RepID=UPI0033E9F796